MERLTRRTLFAAAALPLAAAAAPAPPPGSRKARLRTAICAYSFRNELGSKKMSYNDLVDLAVDLDVDGLDLTVYWFPDTSDAFLIPLRNYAFAHGVEIPSISVRTNCCQPTAELRAKEIQTIKDWVDVAAKLGAGHIRVFGGNVPKTSTEDEAAGWVVEVLKDAGAYAAKHGVVLGLENHGGITERADRILDIIKRVNLPSVRVNLDMGNFNKDAYKQLEMIAPYAANVQVKVEVRDESGNRVACDWERVLRMLKAAGYRGYMSLEYEAKEPAPTAVPRLTRELNALVKKVSAS
ncbi:MAG: sugar phosphate isomerase/epimerase [Bryobacterales bacterium]|nr:sugar phosphate isomerase/epimerase [Bryobacterales bacterium]